MTTRRVLIVEDHRNGADALAMLFAAVGIDTRLHRTGDRVAEAVADYRPHAVILDLSLPVRSGLEVARELAALSPRPPVAVYTGHSDLGPDAGLPPGTVDLVMWKPGDPSTLVYWAQHATAPHP